ncbi:MAG: CopG family ribbon-helix-helix protein [Candidatus Poseidoniaceae archaeon]
MARVLSFSVDDDLDMENLVERAGYKNRSRFLRDAATHYAEMLSSGDLVDRPSEDSVEGTLVLYYQHTVAKKLPDFRHHPEISLISSTHACLPDSHTCVDTLHLSGNVGTIRGSVDGLRRLEGVDRVAFVAAPARADGCC